MKNTRPSDLTLINNIKNNINANRSLLEIIQRHSGIYLNMIDAFAARTSQYINHSELLDEKDYYIYKSVLKYDPSKGAKFSTHLGNETRWMCLNLYNKNKKNTEKLYLKTKLVPDCSHSLQSAIEKERKEFSQEILDKVMKIVDNQNDARIKKIFAMRYIEGKGNKVMPWKSISQSVGLSIQGCINAHNVTIKAIKEKINKE